MDSKLLNTMQYEKLTANQDFFKGYQAKKDKVHTLMEQWEGLQE